MTSLIPAAARPFRLALIQLATTKDKQLNLRRARTLVREACQNGANVVVLPVDPLARTPTSPQTSNIYRNVSIVLCDLISSRFLT
jgi:hypothetical protein